MSLILNHVFSRCFCFSLSVVLHFFFSCFEHNETYGKKSNKTTKNKSQRNSLDFVRNMFRWDNLYYRETFIRWGRDNCNQTEINLTSLKFSPSFTILYSSNYHCKWFLGLSDERKKLHDCMTSVLRLFAWLIFFVNRKGGFFLVG